MTLLSNTQITKIACRRLAITEKRDLALMAWAQEAKILARDTQTSPINVKGLIAAIPELRKMTVMGFDEFSPQIKRILSECGIALVFLPHLKGSFLQGATFLDGNKIVVGLTVRGKDADKFWFSFFHELAHIIYGHIGRTDGTSKEDEDVADAWASNTLISTEDFNAFVTSKDYSEQNICEFALEQGVASGIVVGRLQREGVIKYSMLNGLKDHYEIE